MTHLHIDIETYSSTNLLTSGVYRYTEAEDFEILMVAYAFGDDKVEIVDLARGEELPEKFLKAMQDENILKIAHNAAFERTCFEAQGIKTKIPQWRCSAVKAAYCGLPLPLKGVSEALDLGDKAKSGTGRDLIRYFSVPIKPTKANGKRTRNLPHHDLEKWDMFLEYCKQDVEAEREAYRLTEDVEVPEKDWEMYFLDQKINDKGALVDTKMAETIMQLDLDHSEEMKEKMKTLTGVENPNSPAQLKEWLSAAMQRDINTLAKDAVTKLIEDTESEAVKEVLELRQQTSKTSVKKYEAMHRCAGADGRVRGLFQYYGAGRTGRWAGRLVQAQNLPRNYLKDLERTRSLITSTDLHTSKLLFDDLPEVYSQLLRTAFIAPEGMTLAVADFSAIEARVLAWIANEQWRLDVFSGHGKIYEASAATMFGVPIEDIGPGSDLRDRGKVAELALGYQGSTGALKQMGAEAMGMDEGEMIRTVNLWRAKNPNIRNFWRAVNDASLLAVKTGKRQSLPNNRNITFRREFDSLTVELPSGRKLFYRQPQLTSGPYGNAAIRFRGVGPGRRWGWVDTYGGKLTENITQAIARDLLMESMLNLDKAGYQMVMHIHDEVVAEVDETSAEHSLEDMCRIMGIAPEWAQSLPLGADGFTSKIYKKE